MGALQPTIVIEPHSKFGFVFSVLEYFAGMYVDVPFARRGHWIP